MLSKVLVATDASESSHGVIECIDGLRRVGCQRVVLVHAVSVCRDSGTPVIHDVCPVAALPASHELERRSADAGADS